LFTASVVFYGIGWSYKGYKKERKTNREISAMQ